MDILGALGNIGKSIGSAVSKVMPGNTAEYNRPLYYNRDQYQPSAQPALGQQPAPSVPDFVPPEYHPAVSQVASAINASPAQLAYLLKQENGLKWDPNLKGANPADYGVSQINSQQFPLERLGPVFKQLYGRNYDSKNPNDQILAMKAVFDDRKNSRYIKNTQDLLVSYHLGARGVGLAKAGVEPYKSRYDYYAKMISVPDATSTTPFGQ